MLEISDEQINTEEIVDFGKDSFLKLDIDKYVSIIPNKLQNKVGITPIRPQTALINAINDPQYRFVTACLSRRTGKTFIANVILQLVALVPGSEVLIIAPNYQLASISWDLQKMLLNHFGIERVRENAKDRIIQLANDSVIRIGSVAQVDSCVGRSYDLIIFDEAALEDKGGEAFNIALRPTLDKPNSKCIFISTPRGNNWFREFFDRGFSSRFPEWASIRSTYHENPRVDPKDIEQAKNTLSNAEFAQEYLADFTTFEGQIYSAFDESIHVQDLSELDISEMEVIAGLDLGYRDPTAFVVIAVDYDKAYIIRAWQMTEKTTPDIAKRIRDDIETYDIDYIYIDPANASQAADLAMVYDISAINAEKSQVDGLSYVAGLFEKKRLFIHQGCKGLITAVKNLRWNDKTIKPQQLHNENTHYCDAIRYALYTYSPNMVYIEEEDLEADILEYMEEENFDVENFSYEE